MTEIDTTGDSVAQDGPAQPSLDVQLAQERASGGDLRKLISKVTDKVVDERVAWQNRPLDRVYPVAFVDAIHVKIRDGQVASHGLHGTDRRCGRGPIRRVRDGVGRAASGDHSALAHLVGAVHPIQGFPPEIRKVIYTTNAVESPNARFRQATRRRGHFPNELCALKVLYLVIRNPDANRTNVTGHTTGGKAALNHGGRTSGSVGQAAGHRWA